MRRRHAQDPGHYQVDRARAPGVVRARPGDEELLSARVDGKDVTDRKRPKASAGNEERRGSTVRWSLDEALAPRLPFLPDGRGYRFERQPGAPRAVTS